MRTSQGLALQQHTHTQGDCREIRLDEGRKRVIGLMAAIFAARKLAQYNGGKRVPATVSAISDAVRWAEEIMRAIDDRFKSGG